MAHADAEDRQFAAQLPDQLDHGRHVLRVAGTVRQHDAVGTEGHDLLQRRVERHDRHVAAHAVQLADDIVLDAAVDRHHVVFVVGDARHPAFLAAHARNHVVGKDVLAHFAERLFEGRIRAGDNHLLGAFVTDDARQGAGVHAPDRGNVMLLEDLVQGLRVAEVARRVVVLAHDHAADGRSLRFVILVGHTVITDQRIGHHDHLVRVGGVGHNLLIPHHRGIEDDLVNDLAVGAEAVAVKLTAVLQDHFLRKWFHIYFRYGLFASPLFMDLFRSVDPDSAPYETRHIYNPAKSPFEKGDFTTAIHHPGMPPGPRRPSARRGPAPASRRKAWRGPSRGTPQGLPRTARRGRAP